VAQGILKDEPSLGETMMRVSDVIALSLVKMWGG